MFKRKEVIIPKDKVKYPKYSYVYNTDNKDYYLILDTTKKKFISERACRSWSDVILNTTTEAISEYSLYGKKGFRPGTVIQSVFDAKVYFVGDDKLHPVVTPSFYDILGFSKKHTLVVAESEILFYEIGEPIDAV